MLQRNLLWDGLEWKGKYPIEWNELCPIVEKVKIGYSSLASISETFYVNESCDFGVEISNLCRDMVAWNYGRRSKVDILIMLGGVSR